MMLVFKEDTGPGYAWINKEKSLEIRLHDGAYWMLINDGEVVVTDYSYEEFEKKVGFEFKLET